MNTDILLSTYNGAAFLEELLRSLASQSVTGWRLLVRDDGSADNTMDILKRFQEKNQGRVFILEDNQHLGPKRSFEVLLTKSNAETIMFCDQDDVWMPDKLELQMKIMMDTETSAGKDVPVLVHNDMLLCDDRMNIMADSFWHYQNILPEQMNNISSLLMNNFVTGCTILINKALRTSSIPIPEQTLMFDWWLALIAEETGKIISITLPLVKYRQHDNNAIGAKKWGIKYLTSKLLGKDGFWKTSLPKTKLQAHALYQHLKTKKSNDCHEIKKYTELNLITWILKKTLYRFIGGKRYLRQAEDKRTVRL